MTHPIVSETADWLDEVFDGMTVDQATGEIFSPDGPPAEIVEDLGADLDAKIDGYAAALRRLDANAAICAEEAERYKIRQRIIENRATRLREWIAYCMRVSGRKKVATATTTASIVQNGGKQPIAWHCKVEDLPMEYVITDIVVKPNTEKVRAALEAGEDIEFASLVPRGSRLQIK